MFQLVFGDHDLTLLLPFDPHIEDQLTMLVALEAESAAGGDVRSSKLAALIVDAISSAVDPTEAAPTEKQIRYALGIARELDLSLPADVLRDRETMGRFLDRNADRYRAKLRSRRERNLAAKHL